MHEVVDREPGAEDVVGVDVRALLVLGGATAEDDGQAAGADPLGQLVVVVQREQQYAVDVLAGEVVVEPAVALGRRREQQHQLSRASLRAVPMPRTTPAKNGSPKTRSSDSAMTSATASVRWVTRVRAAWLGT